VTLRHKLPVLVVLAGFLLVLGVPAPVPAQSPGVGQLRERQASLAAESRAAVVQLYGLESRLAQARSDLARVESRVHALERTQASVRRRLQAARRTMSAAQQSLGDQLRYLYEQGTPDPIAVVLGATSLENAIDALDSVHRARRATEAVLDQAARHAPISSSCAGSWQSRWRARTRFGPASPPPPPGSRRPMPSARRTSTACGAIRS
jgi:peptidoglycan hydrolase CwlO-like protein